jgi:dihydrofolate reductase
MQHELAPAPPESTVADAFVGLRHRPRITIVAAIARNRVIGRNNALPWHLPADLARFRQLTLDKTIVMGRRTWESLPNPLSRRRHIVITRNPEYRPAGCKVASSPRAALAVAGAVSEVMVIGGATIYAAMLPLADRLELTLVPAEMPGDAYFPEWRAELWQETARCNHPADARNEFALTFVTLQRLPSAAST